MEKIARKLTSIPFHYMHALQAKRKADQANKVITSLANSAPVQETRIES